LRGETVSDGVDAERFYRERHWEVFTQATELLLQGVCLGYADFLGPLYLEYGSPNLAAGQYFTPWQVATLMAKGLLYDVVEQIEARLSQAYRQFYDDPGRPRYQLIISSTGDYSADGEPQPGHQRWGQIMTEAMIEVLWPYYQPLRILDPAVGSAVLLLAAASFTPQWMIDLGLVEFYACEIDPFVAKLAQVNCGLYGIPLHLTVGNFLAFQTDLKFDVILANPPFNDKFGMSRVDRNRSPKQKKKKQGRRRHG
jgi:hypothetical protein